ncbi:MAG: hypothetical protein IPM74_06460 [Crocinitomicaceae bacterium]|nr:hypothetical protein [Crocinitomicaceae bacterium]MBK8925544.1 hypothetical protein [Crocinitomicaceae bacterium]
MHFSKPIFLVVITVVMLSSCTKDRKDPEIIIHNPENHSEHVMGTSVEVDATFKDDQNLSWYKVYIGEEDGTLTPDFPYQLEENISDKSFDFSVSITVPTGIESVYYLHFELKDAEEKTATTKLMLHFIE